MEKVYSFDAVIIGKDDIDGAYVEFPYDVYEEFGSRGLIKVEAAFDGYKYRGVLAKMGTDCT